jgi:CheY-like chemotaxis protein
MLEKLIVRCSRDVLKFEHFAVLLLDARTNRLNVIMSEGLDDNAWRHELFANAEGNGICGYVVATGRSYVCTDVAADSRYLLGMADARSSLTVPLRLSDKIIGAINIESRAANAFNEEDRQFAEIFANYVALALNILNLLVTARHTAHTQLTGCICAELTGPMNDIIAEIADVMEEHIGDDDLRRRLSLVVDQAAMVRRSILQLAQSPGATIIAPASPPAHTEPLLAGKKILVADDEEPIRQTIRDVLAPHGCQVDLAADGAEAKDKISAGHYDLIISDIKMPKANGYEVFSHAKSRLKAVPVILITAFGYDPNHSIVRARQEGLSAVIFKPFKVKDLMDQIRAALSASAKQ